MDDEIPELGMPTLPRDEPSLPDVPSFLEIHNKTRSRKRPYLRSRESTFQDDEPAYSINTSSDPALFSNDETPDAENYSSGIKRRKKKTYKGTWWGDDTSRPRAWGLPPTNDTASKRRFRRNFDSGIFMEDSSATDLSSGGSLEQELLDAQERDAVQKMKPSTTTTSARIVRPACDPGRRHPALKAATAATLRRMPQSRPTNTKDHLIRDVVDKCLASNNENVDWTGLDVEYLPSTVKDLKSLIKRINPVAVVSDKLAPFEARLKVYLGNNKLSQFPQSLLDLSNIQLLSLRQNLLSEIPPGIQSLINLEELNIASNSLRSLPFELLQLVQHYSLRLIHDSPNPWMPIPAIQEQVHDAPTVLIDIPNKNLVLDRVTISKPVEFHSNGTSHRYSEDRRLINKQPHLSEMVLRALSRHNASKADLSSYLTSEHPEPVRSLLITLYTTQITGGRSCTFCKRNMILPRYQWYEWWDIRSQTGASRASTTTSDSGLRAERPTTMSSTMYDKLLPFQRMACGCVDVTNGMLNEQHTQKC